MLPVCEHKLRFLSQVRPFGLVLWQHSCYIMQPLAQYHTAACTLLESLLHTTMQPLAHYYTATCTLPPCNHLHTTSQPLSLYHGVACTLQYSCLHTTIQPLAHYHAAICILSGSPLRTIMQPLALWTPISQLPKVQIEKVQCSTEREFPELFKTYLTFISGLILVVVMASSNMGTFWEEKKIQCSMASWILSMLIILGSSRGH